MNGHNTDRTANPLVALIADAISIRNSLLAAADDFALALEREQQTRRTAKEQRDAYDAAEAEVLAEVYAGADGKNAETRKAQVEAAKISSQRGGYLAKPWAMRNAAEADAAEATSAREQMDARYKALRGAAELTAAILNAGK